MEIHGPGYSKVILGEDCVDEWEKYLDVMVASIVENGGRSCVNASSVWTPAHAEEISEALAERLARIFPRAAEDEAAQLAPFADPNVASRDLTNDRSRIDRAGRSRRHRRSSQGGAIGELERLLVSAPDHRLL